MVSDFLERGAVVLVDEWGDCVAVFTSTPGANTREFRHRVYAALREGWLPLATLLRWPHGACPRLIAASEAESPKNDAESPKDEVASWA